MGEVFAGRYELIDVLDAGGVGTVWRVWDHRERDYRAAKLLRQSDSDSLLRFVRETSRHIDHPHVVAPYSWYGEDDRVLFTMPLMRGGSLDTLLGDFGALPPGWVVELLRQAMLGLEAVHATGLVHRDLKPANLLLEATGRDRPHLRVSDFGAAATVHGPRLTGAQVVIGTPGYLAPEQLAGDDPQPAQDLYAMGVVALQLLTGLRPAADGTLPATPRSPQGPTQLGALLQVVEALTRTRPQDRPTGAREVVDALTGLGHVPLESGEEPVEVFDQLPPLPPGWGPLGPAATPRATTEARHGATAAPSAVRAGAGSAAGAVGEARPGAPGGRGTPTVVLTPTPVRVEPSVDPEPQRSDPQRSDSQRSDSQRSGPHSPGRVPAAAWALMLTGVILLAVAVLWL